MDVHIIFLKFLLSLYPFNIYDKYIIVLRFQFTLYFIDICRLKPVINMLKVQSFNGNQGN